MAGAVFVRQDARSFLQSEPESRRPQACFCHDPATWACPEVVCFTPPFWGLLSTFQNQLSVLDSDSEFHFLVGKTRVCGNCGPGKDEATTGCNYGAGAPGTTSDSAAECCLPSILALTASSLITKRKVSSRALFLPSAVLKSRLLLKKSDGATFFLEIKADPTCLYHRKE